MKWVVCFDISDDKSRNKVGSLLEEYGVRVQKSVFEIEISDNKLQKLISKIECLIDEEDSVRFYAMHKNCVKNSFFLGYGCNVFEGKDIYFF